MTLPSFLIIGAARSGTTSLYEYCRQHPQVFMSPRKETNFLAFAGEPTAGRSPSYQRMASRAVGSLDEYAALFAGRTTELAVGEASPKYMYHPARSIANINTCVPQARLIAILRHPADRAYSHYLLALVDGHETLPDFDAAVDAEAERIRQGWEDQFHYVERGFYYRQLRAYYDAFPAEQMRVYLHEDLVRDAASLLRDLYAFIGVDPDAAVDSSLRYNSALDERPAPSAQGPVPMRLANSRLWTFLRQRAPWQLRQSIHRGLSLARVGRNPAPPRKADNLPPFRPETRARLIETYRQDVLRLQDLIGRDLAAWLL
jgi:hypothetical protein